MAQETEQNAFRQAVWGIVRQIPPGKVTTYGEIARALGRPRNARLVGHVMRGTPQELNVPCHRVVGSGGVLTAGWLFGHPTIMRSLLEEEDVPFRKEFQVDIKKCFWSPADVVPAADEMDDLDAVARLERDLGEI